MIDLEFMRPYMRDNSPEYFDMFVARTERLIKNKARYSFSPEVEAAIFEHIKDARKAPQRRLEQLQKVRRLIESTGIESGLEERIKAADHIHKNLYQPRRARKALDSQVLIIGIISLFTAMTDRTVSRSEGAVLPVYCHAVYTDIFGKKWQNPGNGPWINEIAKFLKLNK